MLNCQTCVYADFEKDKCTRLLTRLPHICPYCEERAYDFWLSDDEVNATIQFLNEQTTIIQAEPEEEGET